MVKSFYLSFFKFTFLALLVIFLAFLPSTANFQAAPEDLSLAILFDLIITLPILYFLFIRKTKVPNFTLLYVFIFGIISASFIIPSEHQSLLEQIKKIAIPLIEIGIISLVIYRIRAISKSFKKNKSADNDFFDNLLIACNDIFPKPISTFLATEIAVFYYLFTKNSDTPEIPYTYSYAKKSGIKTTIIVLLFLIIIETFVMHILLAKWNMTAAWIITGLSVYATIQMCSILRSLDKRPIILNHRSKTLALRYGFACHSSIPFNTIERIEKSSKTPSKNDEFKSLSAFDILDTHNTILYLKEPRILSKIYGIEKKYKSIGIFLDDPESFIGDINTIIKTNSSFDESMS